MSKKTKTKKRAAAKRKVTRTTKPTAKCMTFAELNALRRLVQTAGSKRTKTAKRTAAVKAIKKLTKNKRAACPR